MPKLNSSFGRFLASTHFKITYRMAFLCSLHLSLFIPPPLSLSHDCVRVSMYLQLHLHLRLNLSSNWPFYAHEHTLDIISISRAISVAKQFITNYAHSVFVPLAAEGSPHHASAPSCPAFSTYPSCCQLQLRIRRVCRFSPQLQVLRAARGRATASG